MKTIIAQFERSAEAERVADRLRRSGLSESNIRLSGRSYLDSDTVAEDARVYVARNAILVALLGAGVLGFIGVLHGYTANIVPGIGPVLTNGIWAQVSGSAFVGILIGALAGSVIGAFIGLGVAADSRLVHRERMQRGGVRLAVTSSEDKLDEVQQVLQSSKAVNVSTTDNMTDKQWRDGEDVIDSERDEATIIGNYPPRETP